MLFGDYRKVIDNEQDNIIFNNFHNMFVSPFKLPDGVQLVFIISNKNRHLPQGVIILPHIQHQATEPQSACAVQQTIVGDIEVAAGGTAGCSCVGLSRALTKDTSTDERLRHFFFRQQTNAPQEGWSAYLTEKGQAIVQCPSVYQ